MNIEEDYIIHIGNIIQLLSLRGFLDVEKEVEFEKEFFEELQGEIVEIELEEEELNQQFNDLLIEQKTYLKQKISKKPLKINTNQTLEAVFIYIPYYKKISNLDILKKYVEKYDQIFVFCDETVIKQIRNKMEKLLQDADIVKTVPKRIDIIHFDNILINLYENSHSCLYTLPKEEELDFLVDHLRLNVESIPKIEVNDPLLLYYGYDKDIIIKQHSVEETTCGESVNMLYVIPEEYDSIYFSYVLYSN